VKFLWTLREKEKLYTGIGTHTDIITSSAIAYIDAINKAIAANARAQKINSREYKN